MSDTTLAVRSERAITAPTSLLDGALSIQKVIEFRSLIQQTMAGAMVEGQHFGRVPGCGDKPTLLQPGAQLLCTLFRLRPEYEIQESNPAPGHKRFVVRCRLYLMGEVPILASEGVGEASSMESKHRYRNAAAQIEETGDEVPKTYWDYSNANGRQAAQKWLVNAYDGQNVGVKKINGAWMVVRYIGGGDEKQENPNPADVFNTVLKMAKKRAFVDATITATSSNDFFTQDLEDLRENTEHVRQEMAQAKAAEVPAETPRKPTESSATLKGWKDTAIHFGKNKGKTLGELPDKTRQWYLDFMTDPEKADKRKSREDNQLIAALNMWAAEAKGQSDFTLDPAPPPVTGSLAKLADFLEFNGIPKARFVATAKESGWITAHAFDAIPENEASALLDMGDAVIDACNAPGGEA